MPENFVYCPTFQYEYEPCVVQSRVNSGLLEAVRETGKTGADDGDRDIAGGVRRLGEASHRACTGEGNSSGGGPFQEVASRRPALDDAGERLLDPLRQRGSCHRAGAFRIRIASSSRHLR